jgi:hypothetical protein
MNMHVAIRPLTGMAWMQRDSLWPKNRFYEINGGSNASLFVRERLGRCADVIHGRPQAADASMVVKAPHDMAAG